MFADRSWEEDEPVCARLVWFPARCKGASWSRGTLQHLVTIHTCSSRAAEGRNVRHKERKRGEVSPSSQQLELLLQPVVIVGLSLLPAGFFFLCLLVAAEKLRTASQTCSRRTERKSFVGWFYFMSIGFVFLLHLMEEYDEAVIANTCFKSLKQPSIRKSMQLFTILTFFLCLADQVRNDSQICSRRT